MSPLETKRIHELVNRSQVFVSNLTTFVQSEDWTVAETAARSAIDNLQELIDRIVKRKVKR